MPTSESQIKMIDLKLSNMMHAFMLPDTNTIIFQHVYLNFVRLYHRGESFSYHVHDEFHFQYVLKGRFYIKQQGFPKQLMASGDCCIIPIGTLHKWECLDDNSIMLGIILNCNDLSYYHQDNLVFHLKTLPWLYQNMMSHVFLQLKGNYPIQLFIPLLHSWLLFLFYTTFTEKFQLLFQPKKEMHIQRNTGIITLITSYLKANYMNKIQNKDLAMHFGLSVGHINRLFLSEHGVTTMTFLIEFRLTKALELMQKDPHLSAKEVCFSCGFHSQPYFSKCFRKKFGFSPKQLRK